LSELGIISEIIISALLVIGAFFILVGSIGLMKLDNSMSRLHAPTKASTLGVGSLLLASIVYAFAAGDGSLHEILVMAFLFVTAPISCNFIAKTCTGCAANPICRRRRQTTSGAHIPRNNRKPVPQCAGFFLAGGGAFLKNICKSAKTGQNPA